MEISPLSIFVGLVLVTVVVLVMWLWLRKSPSNRYLDNLASYRTDEETAPPLKKGNLVNVYVSAAMFNLADILYAVGPGGIWGDVGANYASIAGQGELLCFSDEDEKELKQLCALVGVPWYGAA